MKIPFDSHIFRKIIVINNIIANMIAIAIPNAGDILLISRTSAVKKRVKKNQNNIYKTRIAIQFTTPFLKISPIISSKNINSNK